MHDDDAPLALWHVAPGETALRPAAPGTGAARVRMAVSALSRGTERLVRDGRVPASEHARMRGPAMEGDFPFPVKYGYCAVGLVEDGPAGLIGKHVFALHPHQTWFRAAPEALTPLPEGLPLPRAALLANMETALNAVWDSGLAPGDRAAVIGAGAVGLLTARIAARIPGCEIFLHDTIPERAAGANDLGASAVTQADPAPRGLDVVFDASASAAGMAAGMEMLGDEGTLVSLGWHGAGTTALPLGGPFHSRRLRLVSSQVGRLPPARAPRWDYARRLGAAARLLAEDHGLDALLPAPVPWREAPARMDALLAPEAPGITSLIGWS